MRKLPMLTPSKLDLAALCRFAWSEHAPAWPEEPVNDAMQWGNAVGLVGERLVAGDDPVTAANHAATVFAVDECELAACAGHMAALVATLTDPVAELAIAWDYVTGKARRLERVTHREYGELGPTEMPMTLDLVGRDANGTLCVYDWKTGRGAKEKSAAIALQLAAYACGAAALFGVDSVLVAFAHVDESGVAIEQAPLDALDLGAFSADIKALRVPSDEPSPGTHCDGEYCPIRTVCRARMAMAATVAPQFDPLAPIETEEQACAAFYALKAVESVAAGVWEKVKAFAKRTPINLGDGSTYAQVQCNGRESINVTDEAHKLLLAVAPQALEYSASKAGIARVLPAKEARMLEAQLREMGALKKGAPYTKFVVVKRKKDEAAE